MPRGTERALGRVPMSAGRDSLRFRPLRRADLPTFLTVLRYGVGNLERSTGIDEDTEASFLALSGWRAWLSLRLSRWIGRPSARIYVAVDGARVVGTGTLLTLPKAGYVAGMSTDPEFRGRGIASHILGLLEADAVGGHRDWLALDVDSENAVAIRVYRRAGYREAARFSWYRRAGLPPASAPLPADMAAASRSELKAVARQLNHDRVADFRAALPADPSMLSHSELFVRGPRVEQRTWVRSFSGGAPSAVRALYLRRIRMGVYFPMTGGSEPTPEELLELFHPATEWLRGRAPRTCLAGVLEPVGVMGVDLERLGFTVVASSTTMIRRAVP